jgi:ATP-dependent helicase/nuclease subunit B
MFIPAGVPVARIAAQHILAQAEPLARAVVLVPTRRACVTMREAFQQELGGKASLLPRILPLADLENELLNLLGAQALELLESIPPAMSDTVQRYHLTQLVAEFERERFGAVRLSDALLLAEQLMALQDECARAGVTLTYDALRPLAHADFATHWEQSLKFLAILSVRWPLLEQELGLTIRSAREVRVLEALSKHWQISPPDHPVHVVGSTASQEATARLLHTIAELPSGMVMLPGLSAMDEAQWAHIHAGHPLYHLKSFLSRHSFISNINGR